MLSPTRSPLKVLRDRCGVALPVALLGLVAVSLLVTTALLTSTTEAAISSAQQEATAALYEVDGTMESFLAARIAAQPTAPLAPGQFTQTSTAGTDFQITVAQLRATTVVTGAAPSTTTESYVYSLVARPASGRGRGVGALALAQRVYMQMATNIESAATFTNSFDIRGSSIVSGVRDTAKCEMGEDKVAVQYSNDIGGQTRCGSNNCISGEGMASTEQVAMTSEELREHVLGGIDLDSIRKHATVKFGYDGFPTYDDSRNPSSFDNPSDSDYNWGCPLALMQAECGSEPDTAKYVVAAITVPDGQKVTLNGGHGQGILYIDGDLVINGTFIFKGIIIVDGNTKITGTGTKGTQIQGALLGLGVVDADVTAVLGNALIQYNQCGIDDAENAWANAAQNSPLQFTGGGTTGWFELVR